MYGAKNYEEAGFSPPAPPATERTMKRGTIVVAICFISMLLTKNITNAPTTTLHRVKPQVRPKSMPMSAIPDIQLFTKTLLNGTESSEFLNDMCTVMWPYLSVAASKLMKDIAEPMFEDLLPGPLKKTKFLSINLGTNPMKFDHIDVLNRSTDSIKLHIDTAWEGDVKIDLKSPVIGKYGVKKIRLFGRVSILMKPLVPVMPVLSAMQVAFINPPQLEMEFSGVANVADNSFLRGTVMDVVNDVVASIIVLPNRLLLPILPDNDFFNTYQLPSGVLRVKLVNGEGFKTNGGLFRDVPDVYVKISMGAEKPQISKIDTDSNNPTWDELFDFIYSDAEQIVTFNAYDKDLDKDDFMGVAKVSAHQLLQANRAETTVPLLDTNGDSMKSSITVTSELREFSSDSKDFDANSEIDDDMVGLLGVIIAGASNITTDTELASYAKVTVGQDEQFVTGVVKEMVGVDATNPMYNAIFRVKLTRALYEQRPAVHFKLYNGQHEIGRNQIPFDDVISQIDMKCRRDLVMGSSVLHVLVRLSALTAPTIE